MPIALGINQSPSFYFSVNLGHRAAECSINEFTKGHPRPSFLYFSHHTMSDSDVTLPLSPVEVHARNHALLCSIGFLILLPIGALVPRYTRTLPYKCVSYHPTNNPDHYYVVQMVPRSLAHPVPYSRPSHLRWMGTR